MSERDGSRGQPHDLLAISQEFPAMVGYWDRQHHNRLATRTYARTFGLDPAQLLGRHVGDVLEPELYAQTRPYMDGVLQGEEQTFDRQLTDPAGQPRFLQASYFPDQADGQVVGYFVLLTDITDRRLAEIGLAEEQQRFQRLFDSVPIGALILGPGGRIVDLNQAATRAFGRSKAELCQMTVIDLTHPEDRAATALRLDRVNAGEIDSFHVQKRFLDVHGATIWAQVDATRLSSGGDWRLVEQIQDVSERHHHEQQLIWLAEHDALTGLLNRRAFCAELRRLQTSADRYGPDGAILLIDLDHFKHVNDTLGHQAGDDVLCAVATLLRGRTRGTDVVARLGGDEFAVVLPRGNGDDAEKLARSLVAIFGEWTPLPGSPQTRMTASIGVAEYTAGQSGESLLGQADLAMYAAKTARRAGFARYSTALEPEGGEAEDGQPPGPA